jgi:hypothetical protein
MASGVPSFGEGDLTGFKYFDRLVPMLDRLHDVGCAIEKGSGFIPSGIGFLWSPLIKQEGRSGKALRRNRVQSRSGAVG